MLPPEHELAFERGALIGSLMLLRQRAPLYTGLPLCMMVAHGMELAFEEILARTQTWGWSPENRLRSAALVQMKRCLCNAESHGGAHAWRRWLEVRECFPRRVTWALLVVCTTLNTSCVWAGQICVAGPPGDQIAPAYNFPSATSQTLPGAVGPTCWCPFDEVSQSDCHGVRLRGARPPRAPQSHLH